MTTGSTDSHIVVKPFAWHDWPALWAVRLAQLAEHGILLEPTAIPEHPQPGIDDEHEWDLHHIDQVYLRGAGNFWLAWCADCPVGYVGAQDVGGAIELRRMYVKASYRRLGVGTALVEALIAHSHTQGIRAIELWTAANGPGRRLYHALGFRETEGPGVEFEDITTRTGYTPGADEIRMRYHMTMSPPARDIIHTIIRWATARIPIRAVLLTSTRAIPNARVDALSDYDVILVVQDIHPFATDRAWLHDFGDVLVVYWDPLHPDPVFGIDRVANVTQYADGLKIDFNIWPVSLFQQIVAAPALLAELDAGYRVLLDKDHLTEAMRSPTGTAYVPVRPTDTAYQTLINDFLSDAPYVAKCLLRDELLPAKWCLDYDMKHVYLRQLLEWRLEMDYDWSLPTGFLGKGLKQHLPPDIWAQLEQTYVGARLEDNWDALANTMALFRQVAVQVGAHLGYTYPHELDRRVTAYVNQMRSTSLC